MKTCTKCKAEKPLDGFPPNKRKRDGRQSWCHVCSNREAVAWKKRNPERARAQSRRAQLKYQYGITPEQYDAMFEAQRGKCAICGCPPNGKLLATDHCHSTEQVRGLLCTSCNTSIGLLKHDPVLLRRAADYIEAAR